MPKQEYAPLLAYGFKTIIVQDLEPLFVKPFAHSTKRNQLVRNVIRFINEVKELGINGEVWIDGSFATEKPEPADVDVVFLLNKKQIRALGREEGYKFTILFHKHGKTKTEYDVDVHFIDGESAEDRDYWLYVYGMNYDKSARKGIFRIEF